MRVKRWMVAALALNLVAGLGLVAADELRAEAAAEKVAAEAAPEEPPAAGTEADQGPRTIYEVYETVALAASVAFVTGVSIIGAGMAVGRVGSAAIGAAAEKPELLTRSLLFVALAEGLAVLGFAVAMMLMAKM